MTRRFLPAPVRRLAGAGGLILVACALSGCLYAGGMAAAALVSGVSGSDTAATPAPGTGVQNGRNFDPSIGQALAASQSSPLNACRARLPESEPLAAGQCAVRPVCLPGAVQPSELLVCHAPQ
ncbi:hypothetical protein [Aquibaculum arenosum]|uniref:Lipoprotein n=1 Tax=Aquibaculum arenosum TaxID=3032591 RepID=A0ABT5YLN9_9PROT|nr:hypothetical protein [Fodinicurvata sp. CAU 1616]MDF2095828.1 hypothetical protein [Fodinicurvata sp. CAU 1616]